MPLSSDITVYAAKFRPQSISEQTKNFNEFIVKTVEGAPKWFEVGAAQYRDMRLRGETAFPLPPLLPGGCTIEIESRDCGRMIPCRVIYPSSRETADERKQAKGSIYHIHGGGWVLGDQNSADGQLQAYANAGDLAVISVGYRLAPENPFPKGPEDCIDVGEYLVKHSETEYGGPVRFIGGESSGAHLSAIVAIHLMKTHPTLTTPSLLLHFGCFDLSLSPSAMVYTKQLILNTYAMKNFIAAFVPADKVKHPDVSPFYEDLTPFRSRLPSALFTTGTDDPLLDDTVMMGMKWMMAGGEAIVKLYPGAAHGFISFPDEHYALAGEAMADTKTFIVDCMAKST